MEILSISMDKGEVRKLELAQRKLGFKSRSKMLRSALQSLVKDYEKLDALKGNVEAVFVLTYDDTSKNKVSDALHLFEKDINSELHHHHSSTCIDILTLHTTADTLRRLFKTVKSSKSIKSVTYSIVNGG